MQRAKQEQEEKERQEAEARAKEDARRTEVGVHVCRSSLAGRTGCIVFGTLARVILFLYIVITGRGAEGKCREGAEGEREGRDRQGEEKHGGSPQG